MDTALCLLDGVTYYALPFSQMQPADIAAKRQALVCNHCNSEAFFRSAARSGQGPCFGARPHAPGCPAAVTNAQRGQAGGEPQDILNNPGEVVILDLEYGAAAPVNPLPPIPGIVDGRRGGNHIGPGQRQNVRTRRRLGPILRNLIYSEQFRNSPQVIELPERPPQTISSFFVNFSNIGGLAAGTYKGFWGMISDAQMADDEGSVWVNSGSYRGGFSVLIPPHVGRALFERYNINNLEDLAGCHILAIGDLQRSGNSKPWLPLNDISVCALYED